MPAPIDYSTQASQSIYKVHKIDQADSKISAFDFDFQFPNACEAPVSVEEDFLQSRDLEGSFCRDFSCCGLVLEDLHDLLQHFEECHVRFENDDLTQNLCYDENWSGSSDSGVTTPSSPEVDYNSATSLQQDIISLSDIYAEELAYQNNPFTSAFDDSILRECPSSKKRLASEPLSAPAKRIVPFNFDLTETLGHTYSEEELFTGIPSVYSPDFVTGVDDILQASTGILQLEQPASDKAPVEKPYKCPVPGCEKSYKNANGLKYHKLHGHCSNADGTKPTIKPYKCSYPDCGKSYKNLNGLKYHIEHTHVLTLAQTATSVAI
ncbi:Transcriptional regulator of ribosomal biogenesis proteins [Basidiobolus ranarum]|uniref:Transcriptional regulator of ribosomal biogenesis proteins n=1 Tax=Basidiobolus ranarum TaxID=34480 RepID=A0ABR2X318_9FUNG